MKAPPIGLCVTVNKDHVSFKNSNVPIVRLLHSEEGAWVPNASSLKGLIVYVNEPAVVVLDKIRTIQITAVSQNGRSAFARALYVSKSDVPAATNVAAGTAERPVPLEGDSG